MSELDELKELAQLTQSIANSAGEIDNSQLNTFKGIHNIVERLAERPLEDFDDAHLFYKSLYELCRRHSELKQLGLELSDEYRLHMLQLAHDKMRNSREPPPRYLVSATIAIAQILNSAGSSQKAVDLLERTRRHFPTLKTTASWTYAALATETATAYLNIDRLEETDRLCEEVLEMDQAGAKMYHATRGYARILWASTPFVRGQLEIATERLQKVNRWLRTTVDPSQGWVADFKGRRDLLDAVLLLAENQPESARDLIEGRLASNDSAFMESATRFALKRALARAYMLLGEDPDAQMLIALSAKPSNHFLELIVLTSSVDALLANEPDSVHLPRLLNKLSESHHELPSIRLRTDRAHAELALRRSTSNERLRQLFQNMDKSWHQFLSTQQESQDQTSGNGYLQFDFQRGSIVTFMKIARRLHGDEEAAREGIRRLIDIENLSPFGSRVVDFESIQPCLQGSKRGMLTWIPGIEDSFVIRIDQDSFGLAECLPGDQIRRRVSQWQQKLNDVPIGDIEAQERYLTSHRQELKALTQEASEALLPVALNEWIHQQETLVVVQTDLIGSPPISWLYAQDQPLGVRQATLELGSFGMGSSLADATPKPSGSAEILSLSYVEGQDLPLGDKLQGSLDRTNHIEWDGREEIASLPWDDAQFCVILCHGSVDLGESFAPYRLELGINQPWGAPHLPEKTPIGVLLLSCDSASRPERIGGLAPSLGRAFLDRGSQAVLQTNGPIRLSEARRIGNTIVESLHHGLDLAQALKKVREDFFEDFGLWAPSFDGQVHIEGWGQEARLRR